MSTIYGPRQSSPLDLQSFYEQALTGQVDQVSLEQLLEQSFNLYPTEGLKLTGLDTSKTGNTGGIPLSQTNFAHLAGQDPRAAMARTNAIRKATAVGSDRQKIEAEIKRLFQQLNKDGLNLEARPGSKLAEALANGDLSQLNSGELAALLVALVLYSQNKNRPGNVAQGANIPLAPRGSWQPGGGNSHGGGTSQVGANANARAPQGPAPVGPAPGGTAGGQALAQSAVNVAHRMGSTGYCYRGVKAAVREATGVQLTGGSAYQAADQLASSGRFQEVSVSPNNLDELPPGAVVVWGQTSRSPHGHISVALGDGREASDHVQNQMSSLRGHQNYRVFLPA